MRMHERASERQRARQRDSSMKEDEYDVGDRLMDDW